MNIIGHDQLLAKAPPSALRWIVEGLVKEGSIGFIAGEPKTSKSWLALHIAQCVATGALVLGKFRVPCPNRVLLVEVEDSYETVITRYRLLQQGHSLPEPAPGFLNFMIQNDLRIDDAKNLDEFKATVEKNPPALIIFDVLNKLHTGSDTDQRHATLVMRCFESIRSKFNCAVMIVHHFRKGASKRGNQRLRGSSVFAGWAENSLYLSRDGANIIVEPESKFAEVNPFGYTFQAITGGGLKLEYFEPEDTNDMEHKLASLSHIKMAGMSKTERIKYVERMTKTRGR